VWINRKEIVKKNRQNVGSQNFGPGIKEQILQVIFYEIDAIYFSN